MRMEWSSMNKDKPKSAGEIQAEEKLQKLFKELGFQEKPHKDIEHD